MNLLCHSNHMRLGGFVCCLCFRGVLVLGLFAVLLTGCSRVKPTASENRAAYVVLLHGLGRGPSSMDSIAACLAEAGYTVVNAKYPSTRYPVKQIAETHIPEIMGRCRENEHKKIHFVTHSMGGIVLRQYLQAHQLPPGSRIVMISPPNQGSELVDVFGGWFFFEWIYGPAGKTLGTGPQSLPKRLAPVDAEIGIIAGSRSFNPIGSWIIPGKDDGRVAVESTILPGMNDFLVLPRTHNFIAESAEVCRQVAAFLETGRFKRSRQASEREGQ
ncbi:MAG: alpha/beta fold hydrolase [Desulfobacterales bacterium]|nr:alpha/beta fold hydrolase [Desulfobacterales bacterium]